MQFWCIETTPVEISNALRFIEYESRIGSREALIVASALSGANRILSEDLNAGHTIAGIRLENPFPKDGEAIRPRFSLYFPISNSVVTENGRFRFRFFV